MIVLALVHNSTDKLILKFDLACVSMKRTKIFVLVGNSTIDSDSKYRLLILHQIIATCRCRSLFSGEWGDELYFKLYNLGI